MIALVDVVDVESFYEEHKDAVIAHYDNYAKLIGGTKSLNFDVQAHQNLMDLGIMYLYKIISDSVCVGYVSLLVCPSMLFKNSLEVHVNHIIVFEQYRGKGIAEQVLGILENVLADMGVTEYNLSLPPSEKHKHFAAKTGFSPATVIYNKTLRK